MPPRSAFFGDSREDDALEARSRVFWESLLGRIESDVAAAPASILDVGCHRGGLLDLFARRWRPRRIEGIEPIGAARARATLRLRSLASEVTLHLDWSGVVDAAFELVTCHEVLYLERDLGAFAANVARALAPAGRAYVVLGCHTENPLWPEWRAELSAMGHSVYDHAPLDILRAGARAGLATAVRPLRDAGWAFHNPLDPGFAYPSVGALLDHQFRHKLLFRFTHP